MCSRREDFRLHVSFFSMHAVTIRARCVTKPQRVFACPGVLLSLSSDHLPLWRVLGVFESNTWAFRQPRFPTRCWVLGQLAQEQTRRGFFFGLAAYSDIARLPILIAIICSHLPFRGKHFCIFELLVVKDTPHKAAESSLLHVAQHAFRASCAATHSCVIMEALCRRIITVEPCTSSSSG